MTLLVDGSSVETAGAVRWLPTRIGRQVAVPAPAV